jgi:multiple sugar transport system substrate-binding protein
MLAAAVAPAGCGGGQDASSEIVWWTPNWSVARAADVARRFEAANPGVTVTTEATVADGLPARIQTALRSGAPPDVIEGQHGWVVPYAQANLLLPLDDAIDEREDYLPVSLDYDTWNGRLGCAVSHGCTVCSQQVAFREAGSTPNGRPRRGPSWSRRPERSRDGV